MDSPSTTIGTTLDYAIILAYFAGILIFGSVFGRFTKSTKDFFFGGRRFSWWLIAMSSVATLVGSYSFIKYSQAGFSYGISSTQTYLNDWFLMPLWMFGWLPIIYFGRITSVPEYFERRFGTLARVMATVILMLYMIGYIGINFYTLGVALHKLLGWDVFSAAVLVAVISAIYVSFGGQTSVIMTDLAQGFLLLIAGLALFFLGLNYMGGFDSFWANFLPEYRYALPRFNEPAAFPFVGIFWQDGLANGVAFYFMNQGIIMRYLSARSVQEGRKAAAVVVLVLMPLAAFAVANAGWLGRSMVEAGLIPADTNPRDVFVVVADLVCRPGVFGLIMAALTAALMSTADTLINAVSAVAVNDVYRPYVRKGASDKHYLLVARIVSLATAGVGIALVPVFAGFRSIYEAHGAFVAAVTPPMVATIVLGAFWKRFTPWAAFWTLFGGALALIASIVFPQMISLFSHGVDPSGFSYMRAAFGLVVSAAIGVSVTFFTRPRSKEEIVGLVADSIPEARIRFKGGAVNLRPGKSVVSRVEILPPVPGQPTDEVRLNARQMARLNAEPGDLLFVAEHPGWHGGLRGTHCTAGAVREESDWALIPEELLSEARIRKDKRVKITRIM